MEFRDNLVQFNIFDAMKHPTEDHSLCSMDVIDELVEEYNQFDFGSNNMIILVEISNTIESAGSMIGDADSTHINGVLNRPNSVNHDQQFPVIIANNLDQEQEEKLLTVLRQHKKSTKWKLSNLPGINPSICMHRIMMEEEACPIRQQQRRLNPTILDVVKKEVTKLLVAGIIYPISDSSSQESGMTITKNQHDEMVPTRI
ncbi:hypothetical protein CR513_33705, partial [Mucuna pruriens]